MNKCDIEFQISPPNMHCQNSSEKAIRNYKIILFQDYPPPIRILPSVNGDVYFSNVLSHLIYYVTKDSTQLSLITHIYMSHTISISLPWNPL